MVAAMRVSQLSMTPVKGLALHHPDHLDLTRGGVVGNRAFFLLDESGEIPSCTEVGALLQHKADYDADADLLGVTGPRGLLRQEKVELGEPVDADFYGLRTVAGHVVLGWDKLFSDIVGQPVRLIKGVSGGYDVAPVTLIGAATTVALGQHAGVDGVDSRRFRMNLELSGSEPLDEDSWEGRELRVGEVALRVGREVKRCAATTRDPDTGTVDLQTLKMIGAYKGRTTTEDDGPGFYLGVYAEVTTEGRVRRGDEVYLI